MLYLPYVKMQCSQGYRIFNFNNDPCHKYIHFIITHTTIHKLYHSVLVRVRLHITKILCVILLYPNALCQVFLLVVIQQELANVKVFLFSRGLLGTGGFNDTAACRRKPPC